MSQESNKVRASDLIPKMVVTDDVESYLYAYYVDNGTQRKVAKEQWARMLAPFLSGESQKAFLDLDSTTANDYDSLKKEILSRNGLSTFEMAQRVHERSFQKDQPPHAQFYELMRLTKKWL